MSTMYTISINISYIFDTQTITYYVHNVIEIAPKGLRVPKNIRYIDVSKTEIDKLEEDFPQFKLKFIEEKCKNIKIGDKINFPQLQSVLQKYCGINGQSKNQRILDSFGSFNEGYYELFQLLMSNKNHIADQIKKYESNCSQGLIALQAMLTLFFCDNDRQFGKEDIGPTVKKAIHKVRHYMYHQYYKH